MSEIANASDSPNRYSANPLLTAERAGYPELFYAVLFHPVSTFRLIGSEDRPGNRMLFQALLTVVLISASTPVVQIATRGGNPLELLLTVPFWTIGGVLVWGFVSLVMGLLSYAFTGETRLRCFLVLSGLATLPWIFMGLDSLFKVGLGTPGLVISAVFGLLIWLWSVLLFALALMHSYRMSPERVMIVLIMPFIMILVFLGWLAGFISNIRHLAPL